MKNAFQLLVFFLLSLSFTDCKSDDPKITPPTLPVEYANSIHWGVNIHEGGDDPQNMANEISNRNLKFVRMDYWGNYPPSLVKFRNVAQIMKTQNIKVQAIVFSVFSTGQPRNADYGADLNEVEQTAYNQTKPQIENVKDLVLEYELQNEIPLYKNMNLSGTTGQNATDYDTPAGRLQAAVLRGMSRAIDDVRRSSGLPIRILLGTVDRRFGFLSYMLEQGVIFDVVGYHIYPYETHAPLDQDPWFGEGGPLGQLAKFKKPIHINEFNCGEIGFGAPGRPSSVPYENLAGEPVTEAGFRSIYKHLNEIVNQKVANVEAVHFYEIYDLPDMPIPLNRFGLYYDTNMQLPKISLLLATAFAGGNLSAAENELLSERNFTYYNILSGLSKESIDAECPIKFSPNPVKDILKVQSEVGLQSIEIYNSYGVKLLSHHVNELNNISYLNLTSFPTGIYVVVVNYQQSNISKRIIKL